MLPQRYRRRWYDGYQLPACLGSLGVGIWAALTGQLEGGRGAFGINPEMLVLALLAAAVGVLLWLPIAWLTWRPYVPTEPGLSDDE